VIEHALSLYDELATVVFCIMQKLQPTQCSLFGTILWSLWKRRNVKLCQRIHEKNAQVVERDVHMLENWKLMQEMRQSDMTTEAQPQLRRSRTHAHTWQRHAPGRYKCNVDASFSSDHNKVGIGMCIRDSDGSFVLARTTWFSPLC
jgi:isoaspartyl peptidase/L-asparaginase-like protein (Ntn-hydrolase superfamily)